MRKIIILSAAMCLMMPGVISPALAETFEEMCLRKTSELQPELDATATCGCLVAKSVDNPDIITELSDKGEQGSADAVQQSVSEAVQTAMQECGY